MNNEWGQCQFLATPAYKGATPLIARSHARADDLNLTGVTDGVSAANTQSRSYSPANRLQLAAGPWGSKTFAYDGVGNRLSEATVPVSGLASTDTLSYPAGNNRVRQQELRLQQAQPARSGDGGRAGVQLHV